MSSGVPSADPSITVFGMRPLLKPTLTVGASVLLVITACTDDAGNAQDTAPSTAQPAPAESTEPTRESDGVLTIGVLLPQTGEGSSIGNPGIAAATQAVNEINTAGGVLSQPVTLVIADEGVLLEESQAGVDSLLSQNVDAIVGPASSTVAMDVLDELMAAGVVTCSPTATSMALDDYPNRELFFRTIPSDSLTAVGIAGQASRTGVTAATVVFLDDAFGRPLARAVSASLSTRSIETNPDVLLRPDDDDYADEARALAESSPGTIVLIADGVHGWQMLDAMAAAFDDPPNIIVNDPMRSIEFSSHAVVLPPVFREAIEGVSPNGSPTEDGEPAGPFATNSYDCVNLIALAAVASESEDPAAIAAEIRAVAVEGADCKTFDECADKIARNNNVNYEGPRGRVFIGENGDTSSALVKIFWFDESGLANDPGGLGVTY